MLPAKEPAEETDFGTVVGVEGFARWSVSGPKSETLPEEKKMEFLWTEAGGDKNAKPVPGTQREREATASLRESFFCPLLNAS